MERTIKKSSSALSYILGEISYHTECFKKNPYTSMLLTPVVGDTVYKHV